MILSISYDKKYFLDNVEIHRIKQLGQYTHNLQYNLIALDPHGLLISRISDIYIAPLGGLIFGIVK